MQGIFLFLKETQICFHCKVPISWYLFTKGPPLLFLKNMFGDPAPIAGNASLWKLRLRPLLSALRQAALEPIRRAGRPRPRPPAPPNPAQAHPAPPTATLPLPRGQTSPPEAATARSGQVIHNTQDRVAAHVIFSILITCDSTKAD